jgi:tetratricopeptide (TPR) repeat protein
MLKRPKTVAPKSRVAARGATTLCFALALSALALSAQAQEVSSAKATGTTTGSEAANRDASGKVRTDPKGQTGIAPYAAQLAKGRSAAKAKDHASAQAAFSQAIKLKPEEMYGYLLLAQSQLQQGSLEQALQSVNDGRKKKGEVAIVAKMHHLRAELLERSRNLKGSSTTLKGALVSGWKKARDSWNTLRLFLEAHSQLPDYKEVASARAKAVTDRMDRENKYKAVATRMGNKK